jgi:hypothetical protein
MKCKYIQQSKIYSKDASSTVLKEAMDTSARTITTNNNAMRCTLLSKDTKVIALVSVRATDERWLVKFDNSIKKATTIVNLVRTIKGKGDGIYYAELRSINNNAGLKQSIMSFIQSFDVDGQFSRVAEISAFGDLKAEPGNPNSITFAYDVMLAVIKKEEKKAKLAYNRHVLSSMEHTFRFRES